MKRHLMLLLCLCLVCMDKPAVAQTDEPSSVNTQTGREKQAALPSKADIARARQIVNTVDTLKDPYEKKKQLEEAYRLVQETDEDSLINVILFQLAYNANVTGDWARGFEWATTGMNKIESDSQSAYFPAFANMIALSFEKQRDYAVALEWASKSIRNARGQRYYSLLAANRWAARMQATRYMAFLKYPLDSCLHYGRESMHVGSIDGIPEDLFAFSYASMAIAFAIHGYKDSAVVYLRRALTMHESVQDFFSAQEMERDLARLYLESNQRDSALFYARKAYEAAPAVNNWDVRLDAANILSSALETSNKELSLVYLKEYLHLKDSLFNRDKFNEISIIKTNELLKARDAAEKERRLRNRFITYSLLAGLLLLAFVGIILYRNNQVRKKTNEQLAHKNRELEIEAALEKVRSRSLVMHHTEELEEVVVCLFERLKELGIAYSASGIYLFDQDKKNIFLWVASIITNPVKVNLPFDSEIVGNIINTDLWSLKEKGKDIRNKRYAGREKDDYYRYVNKYNASLIPQPIRQMMIDAECWIASFAAEKHCALVIDSWDGRVTSDEDFQIVKRFARVFEQAYVRFLDLQKSEANAREAKIEAALEKIRSSSLAMRRTDELKSVIATMHEKLKELSLHKTTVAIVTLDEKTRTIHFWIGNDLNENPIKVTLPYSERILQESVCQHDLWNAITRKQNFYNRAYDVNTKNRWFEYVLEHNGTDIIPEPQRDWLRQETGLIASLLVGKHSSIWVDSWEGETYTEDQIGVLKRIATVFDQAYTRFMDLQKAEKQAHQAHIETALERVRARALAMQEPEELVEVAQLLRQEMGALGVDSLETGTVFIHDEGSERAECWFAIRDDRLAGKPLVSDHISLDLNATWVGREMLVFYNSNDTQASIPMRGEHRREWIEYCYQLSPILNGYYGDQIPDRTYHLYKFSNGAIGAAAPGDISADSWNLLQRTASVFSLAYSRFKDLSQARTDLQRLKEEKQRAETALSELKSTQTQLIQAEKMASLGELTAGIAHEIQNPLNFVNNFSEINAELAGEIDEAIQKGDLNEIRALAADIKSNQEKIREHGKRADSIVKGMLQHSRSSTGAKEPTDINKLVDEYLRLAYHGLRAKDKLFNVSLQTNFDQAVGAVSVVPQDIGRVLLNLFNNAFYAVQEKAKTAGPDYQPTVSVSVGFPEDDTSGEARGHLPVKNPESAIRNPKSIAITVQDNGPGIPEAIKDKIFQPFFTTKPTGQGTGLGLSLSYDIIKAHGGDIIVHSGDDSGTSFQLLIPV